MSKVNCGDNQMPTVLSGTTIVDGELINPTFNGAKFTTDCSGRDVTESTPVMSCEDVADGSIISSDAGNVIRPGSDGKPYLGISNDPSNVTRIDGNGDLLTPISKDGYNLTVKGSDGGIYTDARRVISSIIAGLISNDSGNQLKLGKDGKLFVAQATSSGGGTGA